MSVTAEEIEIVVKGNIQDASKKLDDLKAKINSQFSANLSKMQPSIQQATKAMSSYATNTVSKMSIINKEIDLQQQKVKRLAGEYYKSLKSGKNSMQLSDQYKKAQIQLDKLKLKAKQASASVEKQFKPALEKTNKSTNIFIKTFKRMIIAMAIRKVIQSVIQGFQDLAKYSTSFNSSMSQLQSKFLETRNSIASAFAPVLQALTPIITTLTNAVINLFNALAKVNTILFTNKNTFTKAKAVTTDYAKSLGKASNEAKGALASFDELNVIAEPSGADNGMPSPTEMFEEEAIDRSFLSNFDNLSASFDKLKQALEPFKKEAFSGLKWLYENVLKPFGNWTINKGLPTFIDMISSSLRILNSVIQTLKPLLTWLWDNLLDPTLEFGGNAFTDYLEFIKDSLENLADWLSGDKSFSEWFDSQINNIKEFAKNLIEDLKKFWEGLQTFFYTTGARMVNGFEVIWNGIVEGLYKLGERLVNGFKNIWNGIVDIGKSALNAIKAYVINPIIAGFKKMYNGVITIVEGLVNGIIGLFDKFISGINNMIRKLNQVLIQLDIEPVGTLDLIQSVSIPRLAKGGVLTKDTIFMGGEYAGASQNPEIVAPQSLMYETNVKANIPVMNAIEEMADRLVEAFENTNVYADFGYDKLRVGLNNANKRAGNKLYGGAY